MYWMTLPLKRYADFSGRSRRKEFWMFALFQFLVMLVPLLLMMAGMPSDAMEAGMSAVGMIGVVLVILIALALIIPGLAVQVRRFHDQDKSGWFVLLGFIPYVGGLIMLIFMLLPGTTGPNRFGPDPKDPSQAAVSE